MSKKQKTLVREPRHPKGVKLSDALEEDAPRLKAMKGLTDKRATLIKSSDDPEVTAELAVAENMRPTDEQLSRINAFTRSPKTADEVAVFPTLSCNDIEDRDDDKFSTKCVKEFAELPQPFSPIGKSFMMDHNYSVSSQVGRIFGAESKKVAGAQFLKNEVYVPNTPENQSYLQNVDFGIHWAVSVGVVLGKTECTVCQAPFGSYGWWCANGHDKGAYYDPKSDETDSWGYPLPCDPDTKGAIKCIRVFEDPVDMYELSQVFLGAQYFAALDKDPDFRSYVKAAGANVPIIGLKEEEAKNLPLSREPQKVSEARIRYEVRSTDDGSLNWTDENGLRWSFDPSSPAEGVTSLGKAATNKQEDSDGRIDGQEGDDGLHGQEQSSASDPDDNEEQDDRSGDEGSGSGSGSGSDHSAASGEPELGQPSPVTAAADDEDDEDEEESDEEDSDDEDDESSDEEDSDEDDDEEKGLSKESVVAAARKAKLADSAVEAARKGAGNGLAALLHVLATESKTAHTAIKALTPKAALGETYIKSLRADAIDWFVKARATDATPSVKTETFEKKLDRFGDDVELLEAEIEEQRGLAQAKFPKSVRRSSFDDDPNARKAPQPKQAGESEDEEVRDEDGTFDKRIRNIHG